MGVYKNIQKTTQIMKLFGVANDEIVDTFFKMSPDPFHSVGFISYHTGVDCDIIVQILSESGNFIRLDRFVWTTEEKIKFHPELDNFEKLV